jgi:hypothetical protein
LLLRHSENEFGKDTQFPLRQLTHKLNYLFPSQPSGVMTREDIDQDFFDFGVLAAYSIHTSTIVQHITIFKPKNVTGVRTPTQPQDTTLGQYPETSLRIKPMVFPVHDADTRGKRFRRNGERGRDERQGDDQRDAEDERHYQ